MHEPPPADITPSEFETFVTKMFSSASSIVNKLKVTQHEKIVGTDGTYDFDCTVRYEFMNVEFLVLVEAKLHSNPIKRELVQVLYQKLLSVGAHKAVMVSTAPYQQGALTFAKTHRIALLQLRDGLCDFVLHMDYLEDPPSRRFHSPNLHGFVYELERSLDSVKLLHDDGFSDEYNVAEYLLGVPCHCTIAAQDTNDSLLLNRYGLRPVIRSPTCPVHGARER
ncbi:MAG TPA: restriction endonuclease [Acidobacteriaceae bacterium]|nr:restriction endonuclease [Acidobacteriaceae bacterium]